MNRTLRAQNRNHLTIALAAGGIRARARPAPGAAALHQRTQPPYRHRYATTSLAFGVAQFMWGVAQPMAGALADHWRPRLVMPTTRNIQSKKSNMERPSHQAVGAIARRAAARQRQRRLARTIYDAPRQLDDRTLRDLGFDRAEKTLGAAELTGKAENAGMRTRLPSHSLAISRDHF